MKDIDVVGSVCKQPTVNASGPLHDCHAPAVQSTDPPLPCLLDQRHLTQPSPRMSAGQAVWSREG